MVMEIALGIVLAVVILYVLMWVFWLALMAIPLALCGLALILGGFFKLWGWVSHAPFFLGMLLLRLLPLRWQAALTKERSIQFRS